MLLGVVFIGAAQVAGDEQSACRDNGHAGAPHGVVGGVAHVDGLLGVGEVIGQQPVAVGSAVDAPFLDVLQDDVLVLVQRVLYLVGCAAFEDGCEGEACQGGVQFLDGEPPHGLLLPGVVGGGCPAVAVVAAHVHHVEALHALVVGLLCCGLGRVDVRQSHAVRELMDEYARSVDLRYAAKGILSSSFVESQLTMAAAEYDGGIADAGVDSAAACPHGVLGAAHVLAIAGMDDVDHIHPSVVVVVVRGEIELRLGFQ